MKAYNTTDQTQKQHTQDTCCNHACTHVIIRTFTLSGGAFVEAKFNGCNHQEDCHHSNKNNASLLQTTHTKSVCVCVRACVFIYAVPIALFHWSQTRDICIIHTISSERRDSTWCWRQRWFSGDTLGHVCSVSAAGMTSSPSLIRLYMRKFLTSAHPWRSCNRCRGTSLVKVRSTPR